MNPRERPGKRGLVFPPSWSGDELTPAQEAEHELLQEAEGECAPADEYWPEHPHHWLAIPMTNIVVCECGERRRWWQESARGLSWRAEQLREEAEAA